MQLLVGLLMMIFLFQENPVYAMEPSSEQVYRGIDVSKWQGEIDFDAVKESGVEVVYLRSTYGKKIDELFDINYQKAQEANLKIGVYHYLAASNVSEAVEEAIHFASVIEGKEFDCRLAMDFEDFFDLSPEEINEIASAFLKKVESLTGQSLVVYTNASNAENLWVKEVANYPIVAGSLSASIFSW